MSSSGSATNYPFPKCSKGHDLSGEDAFIYDGIGQRSCRMCASSKNTKPAGKKWVKGAFDGGSR